MTVKASRATNQSTDVQKCIQANNKETIKALFYLLFVLGTQW